MRSKIIQMVYFYLYFKLWDTAEKIKNVYNLFRKEETYSVIFFFSHSFRFIIYFFMTASEHRFLLVKAKKAILSPSHSESPIQVLIDQDSGKIVEIANECKTVVSQDLLQVIVLDDNQVLMPGFVDAHGNYIYIYKGN